MSPAHKAVLIPMSMNRKAAIFFMSV